MFGSDMGGFGERGGPALVDRFGRSLRDSLRIPQPVSGQLVMSGGETAIYLGAPPVAGSLRVYRNRILVHPNTYTLAGLTLTLNGGKQFYVSDILDIFYLSLYPPKTAASLPITATYFGAVMSDGPLGYWRANETSGTTMVDSSGNGYNAAYGPNVLLNQPALFPGNSSCIGMSVKDYAAKIVGPTGPLLALRSGAWTLECIAKKTGDGGYSTSWMLAYDRGLNPTSLTPLLGMTYFGGVSGAGTPAFHDQVTSYYNLYEIYSPNHTGGSIMHLALVFDGAYTLKGYENGVLAWTSSAGNTTDPVDNIWFLGNSQGSANGFQGYGSDFAIYNKALSATRIAAHYASMIVGTVSGDRDPYLRTVDLSASNTPSANLVASVDPTDPTQFKFVANSGGGMTKIAQVVCSGSPTTVTFSSIPATYTDLKIIYSGRDVSSSTSGLPLLHAKFNGDSTSSNYTASYWLCPVMNTSGTDTASPNTGIVGVSSLGICVGIVPCIASSGVVGAGEVLIPNYAGTTFQKMVRTTYEAMSASSPLYYLGTIGGIWKSSVAITSIVLTTTGSGFENGSKFTLYGLG